MEQSRLRIQMLGGFSVTYDGRPAFEEVLQSRRMRRLLQYLLLNSGREVTHGELITAMWGDAGTVSSNCARCCTGCAWRPAKMARNSVTVW